jgi:hypothetical protein
VAAGVAAAAGVKVAAPAAAGGPAAAAAAGGCVRGRLLAGSGFGEAPFVALSGDPCK